MGDFLRKNKSWLVPFVIAAVAAGLLVLAGSGWWNAIRADLENARIAQQNERILEENNFLKSKTVTKEELQEVVQDLSSENSNLAQANKQLLREIKRVQDELEDAGTSEVIVGGGDADGTLNIPATPNCPAQQIAVRGETETVIGKIENVNGDAHIKGNTNVKVYDKADNLLLEFDTGWTREKTNIFQVDPIHVDTDTHWWIGGGAQVLVPMTDWANIKLQPRLTLFREGSVKQKRFLWRTWEFQTGQMMNVAWDGEYFTAGVDYLIRFK